MRTRLHLVLISNPCSRSDLGQSQVSTQARLYCGQMNFENEFCKMNSLKFESYFYPIHGIKNFSPF